MNTKWLTLKNKRHNYFTVEEQLLKPLMKLSEEFPNNAILQTAKHASRAFKRYKTNRNLFIIRVKNNRDKIQGAYSSMLQSRNILFNELGIESSNDTSVEEKLSPEVSPQIKNPS